MSRDITLAVVNGDPEAYEDNNVHVIYDEIASHFSSTRYKPWPIVANFLSDLPTGWVGLDAGTGNGKYLSLPTNRLSNILTIGLDRSYNLLKIARHVSGTDAIREVVWGNVLHSCWRAGCFDYAISIATIHHLTTSERRITAVQRLLEAVSSQHGRLLIYVWAIEQDNLSKRRVPTNEASLTGQDVLVPWVCAEYGPCATSGRGSTTHIYNRYYHMFAKGELSELLKSAAHKLGLEVAPIPEEGSGKQGIEIVREGWERSNYYLELRRWHIP
ncbi:hypothetical protein AX15_004952 [Amanita polypyramis BW_CC]|nr:hypothetical protein AX15_004952 [Amanita polypyramis BW_CC]